MPVALIYITESGRLLAERLTGLYPGAQVVKFAAAAVPRLWETHERLVFIMAAGIVVRTIAPLVRDKKQDPAVVVLDEKGRFAISLLSGHLGGANEAARAIADFLGGEAVITTASDVNRLPSLDLWARDNGLLIEEWELLPRIGTRFLDTGTLPVYAEIDISLPDAFRRVSEPARAEVLITHREDVYRGDPAGQHRRGGQLYLRPRNLILGIGCNSRTPLEEIEEAVRGVLHAANLAFSSVGSLATIDIKAAEPGLAAFAEKYSFPLASFTPAELNRVPGVARSEAVFRATGAHAVSEPAALLAAGEGALLVVPKQKTGNVTVAAAAQKYYTGKRD
ncbi:MAG: cobalamin biosynthesis protein [Thermodesulfovibrionales bacterium]